MGKVIFRRIGGRVIPIKQGKKMSKFLSNQEASDHFMQKGLENMLRNDVKKSGALAHESANLQHMARNMHRLRNGSDRDRITKRIKDFIRKNRK